MPSAEPASASCPVPVAAVLTGGRATDAVLEALGRQTHAPIAVFVADFDPPAAVGVRTVRVDERAGVAGAAHAGLSAAMETAAEWLWLLDGSAVPADDALERLLDVLDDPGDLPSPALLASAIVGSDGEPHPDALPFNRLTRKEVTIEAARHRLVAIRAARHGSLLAAREAIAAAGLPRADYVAGDDDLEWTARVLREQDGYLVPASTAVRVDPAADVAALTPAPSARRVRNDVDMLRGTAWGGEERLWLAYLVAADLARGLRAHPRAARAVLRGLSCGLRSSG